VRQRWLRGPNGKCPRVCASGTTAVAHGVRTRWAGSSLTTGCALLGAHPAALLFLRCQHPVLPKLWQAKNLSPCVRTCWAITMHSLTACLCASNCFRRIVSPGVRTQYDRPSQRSGRHCLKVSSFATGDGHALMYPEALVISDIHSVDALNSAWQLVYTTRPPQGTVAYYTRLGWGCRPSKVNQAAAVVTAFWALVPVVLPPCCRTYISKPITYFSVGLPPLDSVRSWSFLAQPTENSAIVLHACVQHGADTQDRGTGCRS